MRRAFVWAQWVAVAAIVAFALYISLRSHPEPERSPERWTAWSGFYALSYTGILGDDEGAHVTPDLLARHLAALREAGYEAITPDDAATFLKHRAPLPDKAVLLLFEGGRKDNFLRATPKLRDAGFVAALCVPTGVTKRWGSFYLKKDELEKVAELPHWRLCSMGHDSYEPVPVDAAGTDGHFLTSRRWQDGQRETETEYRDRIAGDLERASAVLEEVNERPVSAFVYPYADWGASPESQSVEARINSELVARHHEIAFIRGGDPFNGLNANPLALSRLRVKGGWSAERLLAELRSFAPRTTAASMAGGGSIWREVEGVTREGDALRIAGGATAWVRGSGDWRDVDVQATVELPGAQSLAAIYARHSGPDGYLRASLSSEGVWLQERTGGRTRNLGGHEIDDATGTHELRLRVKGRRAWLWLDADEVAGPVPVAGITRHGRVGVGAQGGEVRLGAFDAEPLRARFMLAPGYNALDAVQRDAAAAVLPPWFADGEAHAPGDARRRELLSAAAAGIETIPVVRVESEQSPQEAERLAASIADALSGEVFGRLVTRLAVDAPGTTLVTALAREGYAVVHLVDAQAAVALAEAGTVGDADVLLVSGSVDRIRAVTDRLLHRLPPSQIVARVENPDALPVWMRAAVAVEAPQ